MTSAAVTSLSSPAKGVSESFSVVPMSMVNPPGAARVKSTRPVPLLATVMSSVVLRPVTRVSSAPASPSWVSLPSPLFQIITSLPLPPSTSSAPVKPVRRSLPSLPIRWSLLGPALTTSSPAPPSIVRVPAAAVRVCGPATVESKSVASAKPVAVPRLCCSRPLLTLMMMVSAEASPVSVAVSPVTAPVTAAPAAAGTASAAAAATAASTAVRATCGCADSCFLPRRCWVHWEDAVVPPPFPGVRSHTDRRGSVSRRSRRAGM